MDKIYRVRISQVNHSTVEIVANSPTEAIEIVKKNRKDKLIEIKSVRLAPIACDSCRRQETGNPHAGYCSACIPF